MMEAFDTVVRKKRSNRNIRTILHCSTLHPCKNFLDSNMLLKKKFMPNTVTLSYAANLLYFYKN